MFCASLDIIELSSQSTYLSKCCKMLEHWQDGFVSALEVCKEYNPFLGKVDMSSNKGPSILKHKSLLDPKNSPFKYVHTFVARLSSNICSCYPLYPASYHDDLRFIVLQLFLPLALMELSSLMLKDCGISYCTRKS